MARSFLKRVNIKSYSPSDIFLNQVEKCNDFLFRLFMSQMNIIIFSYYIV